MDCFLLQSPIPYSRYIDFQKKNRIHRRECILILEHPNTITAGINHKQENLLVSRNFLKEKEVDFQEIARGGDFTAHEPGQIVIYPQIDLRKRELAITDFLEIFQKSILRAVLQVWDIHLIANPSSPGLYLHSEPEKKIVSLGVYFKSFFTSFGAALNLKNSLETFRYIHPCGGLAENITSIKKLGLDVSKEDEFKHIFLDLFFSALREKKN